MKLFNIKIIHQVLCECIPCFDGTCGALCVCLLGIVKKKNAHIVQSIKQHFHPNTQPDSSNENVSRSMRLRGTDSVPYQIRWKSFTPLPLIYHPMSEAPAPLLCCFLTLSKQHLWHLLDLMFMRPFALRRDAENFRERMSDLMISWVWFIIRCSIAKCKNEVSLFELFFPHSRDCVMMMYCHITFQLWLDNGTSSRIEFGFLFFFSWWRKCADYFSEVLFFWCVRLDVLQVENPDSFGFLTKVWLDGDERKWEYCYKYCNFSTH